MIEPADGNDEAELWRLLPDLDVESLAPAVRLELAEHWTESALAEHASIASFNRFSLHLLAVGAPSELVEAAQEAALDEVRHARICFALASTYAGAPRGPGKLHLEGDLLGALDLGSVASATATEGCIGETLAALEIAAARQEAEPPAVRAALAVLAADEMRHAELAWTFVRWALEVGGVEVRRRVEGRIDAALGALRGERAPAREPSSAHDLGRHGCLGEAQRRKVRARALDEVIRPAVAALWAEERSR